MKNSVGKHVIDFSLRNYVIVMFCWPGNQIVYIQV